MNQRAAELGALNSRFQNSHGLDKPGHFSTAYDLALISRIALVYPTFAEIVRKRTYQYEGQTWTNTNKLLWRFEGLEGIKTGTTSGAGYCLVAAASQDGMQLISVVLGSNNRWDDSSRLLSWGFEEFHLLTLAQQGEMLAAHSVGRRDGAGGRRCRRARWLWWSVTATSPGSPRASKSIRALRPDPPGRPDRRLPRLRRWKPRQEDLADRRSGHRKAHALAGVVAVAHRRPAKRNSRLSFDGPRSEL